MTDNAIPDADRAAIERLLGPPDVVEPEGPRWRNVRLHHAGDSAASRSAYDAGRHEEVLYHHDAASGLRAIIAVHSTALGPSLGGTRWYPYADAEAALRDALRLSTAMTAKAAVAGLDLGGGKATVIGDPAERTPAQLAAYARAIERLEGRYITTTDVGTTTADLDALSELTSYVTGASREHGGSGDTSELTAETVMLGMRAALRVAFGDEALAGRRVVVVGVGKVGGRVAARGRGGWRERGGGRRLARGRRAPRGRDRRGPPGRRRGVRRAVRRALAQRPRRRAQRRLDPGAAVPRGLRRGEQPAAARPPTTRRCWPSAASSTPPTTS